MPESTGMANIGAGWVGGNLVLFNKSTGATLLTVKADGAFGTGYAFLDLSSARIISSNAIQNLTEAGVPDGNTDPALSRVNGATDIAMRLVWAAGSTIEIQFPPVPLPPDIDISAPVTVNLLIGKDANANTAAVVAVKAFVGLGDTNAGGNTAALATATITKYGVAIAAVDLAAYPTFLNVGLQPGAHANDAEHLYGAWIEYTRK